jgi:hypothetical protein
MAWMGEAACLPFGDLPWTTDPKHTTARELHLMAEICHGCPVLKECAGYANQQRVTAGFWAGRHRDPCAPSLAGPGWDTEHLPGLGGLGGAA